MGSRRGAAVDGCGRRLGTVVPWPSYLRRVIDPPRGARQHTVPLDGGPPERGDESLWAWGDCRTPVCHTQPWVCAAQHLCDTLLELYALHVVHACRRGMVCVPLQCSTPSCEQQPESHNGCGHTRNHEPDSPVTRRTGEELR